MRRTLVVLLALLGAAACGDEQTVARPRLDGAGWERLGDPPLAPRTSSVGIWTGEEVLYVGGTTFTCPPNAGCMAPDDPPLADGAAVDVASGEWRTIAPAPVPVLSATTAVVDGAAYLLAVTGYTDETAFLRYHLADDRWEQLPLPQPGEGRFQIVGAGEHGVVAYRSSHEQGHLPDFVFDPDGDTWEPLPREPLSPAFDRSMVWSPPHLYLFDHELVPNPGSEEPSLTRGARLDPGAGTWEQLPRSQILASGPWFDDGGRLTVPMTGGADGGDTNGWGRTYPYGGTYDISSGSWEELPDAGDGFAADAYGRASAAYFSADGLLLDTVAGRWVEMPRLDEPADTERSVVTAGTAAVVFGGVVWQDHEARLLDDAWIWRGP